MTVFLSWCTKNTIKPRKWLTSFTRPLLTSHSCKLLKKKKAGCTYANHFCHRFYWETAHKKNRFVVVSKLCQYLSMIQTVSSELKNLLPHYLVQCYRSNTFRISFYAIVHTHQVADLPLICKNADSLSNYLNKL